MARLVVFGLCLVLAASSTETTCADSNSCSETVAPSLIQSKTSFSKNSYQHKRNVEAPETQTDSDPSVYKKAGAEFIAMTLFVVIGCGSAMGIAKEDGSAWVLQVSLTFGFAITVLAYTIGHYSGGQINCAVTFGLVLAGQLSVMQACMNFVAQMLGSVAGALILLGIYPKGKDKTGGLGSNSVGDGYTWANAFLAEAMMTFLLMYVVLETAVNPATEANRALACVAIGFAVFLAHSVLIPIDGCSINPTRSFGPMIVSKLSGGADTSADTPVFWGGPLTGAALAAGVYQVMAVSQAW